MDRRQQKRPFSGTILHSKQNIDETHLIFKGQRNL